MKKTLLLLLLLLAPAWAEGDLDVLSSFEYQDITLNVATFTLDTERVSLLGMLTPRGNTSFAFDGREWNELFVPLWDKAQKMQNPAATAWTSAGHMQETETKDLCQLDLEAGPGVRFTITDPELGKVVFVLSSEDCAAFNESVKEVQAFFR